MTNVSSIIGQLKLERDRVERQLTGLNAALTAFANVYSGATNGKRQISAASRSIDKETDGGELRDTLKKESLVEFTAGDVMYFLENGQVGFTLEVLLEPVKGNVIQIPLSILPA